LGKNTGEPHDSSDILCEEKKGIAS